MDRITLSGKGSCSAFLGPVGLLLITVSMAWAGEGHLEFRTPHEGTLHLIHAEGWKLTSQVAAPASTLWDLPSGPFQLVFRRDGSANEARGECLVHDQMTTILEIAPENRIHLVDRYAGAHGAAEQFDPAIWRALPGQREELIDVLDTRVRIRPGAIVDGLDVLLPTERREIVPGGQASTGSVLLSQTGAGSIPGAPSRRYSSAHRSQERLPSDPSRTNAQEAPYSDRPLRFTLGTSQSSRQGTLVDAQLGMNRWPFLGLPGRGLISVRYSGLKDASPRPEGGRPLPHNEATVLDLVGSLELGSPARLTTWGGGSRGESQGSPTSNTPYGLSLEVASRGWQRDHFLQEYRYDLDHAPYEQTALFQSRLGLSMRTGRASRAHAWAGYNRYLSWLGDGTHREEIADYLRPGGEPNGGADDTGLYWVGYDPTSLTGAHAFDYYLRKFTSTYDFGFDVRQARGPGGQWGLTASAHQYTYRRYEHYSPLTDHTIDSEHEPGRILRIGYTKMGDTTGDYPHAPGTALGSRVTMWDKRQLSPGWRLSSSLGAHYFSCDDSALVSFEKPRGDDGNLDAGDLRAVDATIDIEARLALRGSIAPETQAWILAERAMHRPPLEALFTPRAYLDVIEPEGVMGNPDLHPEKETSIELGLGRPLPIGGRTWNLQAALYATLIDDAISLGEAFLGEASDYEDAVPVYVSDGRLEQMGFHLAATAGEAADGAWVRLAYDFSRTQSDFFEPPLLNHRWLYPDRPQGEYSSEGYAGPIGGIMDLIQAAEAGNSDRGIASRDMRPSNLDRPHRLSLALVSKGRPVPRTADWLRRLTGGWTMGLVVRFESGHPYTQVYGYPAGLVPSAEAFSRGPDDPAWESVFEDAQRNDERMPARLTLDVALSRRLALGERGLRISLEALNIPGLKNAVAVYRTTGKPDDDGCSGSESCSAQLPAEVDAATYQDRVLDPRNYDRPFVLRLGVSVDLL